MEDSATLRLVIAYDPTTPPPEPSPTPRAAPEPAPVPPPPRPTNAQIRGEVPYPAYDPTPRPMPPKVKPPEVPAQAKPIVQKTADPTPSKIVEAAEAKAALPKPAPADKHLRDATKMVPESGPKDADSVADAQKANTQVTPAAEREATSLSDRPDVEPAPRVERPLAEAEAFTPEREAIAPPKPVVQAREEQSLHDDEQESHEEQAASAQRPRFEQPKPDVEPAPRAIPSFLGTPTPIAPLPPPHFEMEYLQQAPGVVYGKVANQLLHSGVSPNEAREQATEVAAYVENYGMQEPQVYNRVLKNAFRRGLSDDEAMAAARSAAERARAFRETSDVEQGAERPGAPPNKPPHTPLVAEHAPEGPVPGRGTLARPETDQLTAHTPDFMAAPPEISAPSFAVPPEQAAEHQQGEQTPAAESPTERQAEQQKPDRPAETVARPGFEANETPETISAPSLAVPAPPEMMAPRQEREERAAEANVAGRRETGFGAYPPVKAPAPPPPPRKPPVVVAGAPEGEGEGNGQSRFDRMVKQAQESSASLAGSGLGTKDILAKLKTTDPLQQFRINENPKGRDTGGYNLPGDDPFFKKFSAVSGIMDIDKFADAGQGTVSQEHILPAYKNSPLAKEALGWHLIHGKDAATGRRALTHAIPPDEVAKLKAPRAAENRAARPAEPKQEPFQPPRPIAEKVPQQPVEAEQPPEEETAFEAPRRKDLEQASPAESPFAPAQPETPEPPEVSTFTAADYKKFADKRGEIDMAKAREEITRRHEETIDAGGTTHIVTDGGKKRVQLDREMRDKEGNRWGTMPLAFDNTGKERYEFTKPAPPRKEQKPRAPGLAATPPAQPPAKPPRVSGAPEPEPPEEPRQEAPPTLQDAPAPQAPPTPAMESPYAPLLADLPKNKEGKPILSADRRKELDKALGKDFVDREIVGKGAAAPPDEDAAPKKRRPQRQEDDEPDEGKPRGPGAGPLSVPPDAGGIVPVSVTNWPAGLAAQTMATPPAQLATMPGAQQATKAPQTTVMQPPGAPQQPGASQPPAPQGQPAPKPQAPQPPPTVTLFDPDAEARKVMDRERKAKEVDAARRKADPAYAAERTREEKEEREQQAKAKDAERRQRDPVYAAKRNMEEEQERKDRAQRVDSARRRMDPAYAEKMHKGEVQDKLAGQFGRFLPPGIAKAGAQMVGPEMAPMVGKGLEMAASPAVAGPVAGLLAVAEGAKGAIKMIDTEFQVAAKAIQFDGKGLLNGFADASAKIPFFGQAVSGAANSLLQLHSAVEATVEKFSQYNGRLAAAQAQEEVRQMQRDIMRANRFGPELEGLAQTRSQVNSHLDDVMDKLAPIFMKFTEGSMLLLDDFLMIAKEMLDILAQSGITLIDIYKGIMRWSTHEKLDEIQRILERMLNSNGGDAGPISFASQLLQMRTASMGGHIMPPPHIGAAAGAAGPAVPGVLAGVGEGIRGGAAVMGVGALANLGAW